MPGKVVETMRKRKGIKPEVPGYENVSRLLIKCLGLPLTHYHSTTTSCREFIRKILDFARWFFHVDVLSATASLTLDLQMQLKSASLISHTNLQNEGSASWVLLALKRMESFLLFCDSVMCG